MIWYSSKVQKLSGARVKPENALDKRETKNLSFPDAFQIPCKERLGQVAVCQAEGFLSFHFTEAVIVPKPGQGDGAGLPLVGFW